MVPHILYWYLLSLRFFIPQPQSFCVLMSTLVQSNRFESTWMRSGGKSCWDWRSHRFGLRTWKAPPRHMKERVAWVTLYTDVCLTTSLCAQQTTVVVNAPRVFRFYLFLLASRRCKSWGRCYRMTRISSASLYIKIPTWTSAALGVEDKIQLAVSPLKKLFYNFKDNFFIIY